MSILLKKSLPHLAATGIFLLLSIIFFRPQLSGKLVQQGDIMQYLGMAKEANDFKEKNGYDPLWTNSMFGGMPTYQINTVTAGNNLQWLEKAGRLFIAEPIGQFLLAMLSFYLLMVVLGVNHTVAIIGAVAFGLTTNNLILYEAGHVTKLKSISFFPLIAAGALLTFKGRYLWGGVLFAVGLGLNIYANHIQMTYYLALTFVFLGIAQLVHDIREGKVVEFFKAAGVLVLGAGLALGTAASNLMTTYEYSRDTMRGKPILTAADSSQVSSSSQTEGLAWDYAMQWSNGALDVMAGFIPGVAGGGSSEKVGKNSKFYQQLASLYRNSGQTPPPGIKAPLYHGDLPFTSGPIYFGAVVCFLFILGLFTVKGPAKWWIGLGALLTILLSMGSNLEGFNRFFFDHVPLYNKFRTPNSVLSITSFLLPVLACMALAQAIKHQEIDKKQMNALYIALGVTGAVALFFALLGPSFFDFAVANDENYTRAGFSQEGLINDRKALMRSDAFRSFFLVLMSAGLLWAYWTKKITRQWLLGGFALLVLFDVWSAGRRYLDDQDFTDRSNYEARFKPTPADELISKDKDPNFRVYDRSEEQSNPFASSRASYFHKSIGGYHAAKLQRYQDLIDRHLSKGNIKVFNMLNTKYFIMTDPDGKPAVEPNVNALGNAWFVSNIQMVNDANAEIEALEPFNPEEDAVIHKEFESYIKGFQPQKGGEISLTEYQPNHLSYQSSAPSEQLAVFSEIWYGPNKGWKAYIDGQPAEHIRANYVLRAMRIPAGDHKIEFKFDPDTYNTGKLISAVTSSIVLAGLLGLIGFFGYRSWGKWQQEEAAHKAHAHHHATAKREPTHGKTEHKSPPKAAPAKRKKK